MLVIGLHSSVYRGSTKVAQFARAQLKHPAVANFVRGTAGIAAVSGFNPEEAISEIATRTAQEGIFIYCSQNSLSFCMIKIGVLTVHCKNVVMPSVPNGNKQLKLL